MKTILLLALGILAQHSAAFGQAANTDSLQRVLESKSKQVEGKANYLLRLSKSLLDASRRPAGTPPRRSSLAVAPRRAMPTGRQPHSIAPPLPVDSAAVSSDPEAAPQKSEPRERGRFWKWLRNLFDSIFHSKHKHKS
jgi:hypothetical protein